MRRSFIAAILLTALLALAGCSGNKWNYFVNQAYLSDYVNLSEGRFQEAAWDKEWLILDVSFTNISGKTQYMGVSNDFALVVDGEYIIENSDLGGAEHGLPHGTPILAGSTVRFELYFEIPIGLLDDHLVGFLVADGAPIEPMSLNLIAGDENEAR